MAEQQKHPLSDVRPPLPPRPAQRKPERDLPKVGDDVWYRLSSNMELVHAKAIDSMPTGNPQQPTLPLLQPRQGSLHLKIDLDPERHFSASNVGYRQNVPEAPEDGTRVADTWQREPPDDEEKDWFARYEYDLVLRQQVRRDMTRTGSV